MTTDTLIKSAVIGMKSAPLYYEKGVPLEISLDWLEKNKPEVFNSLDLSVVRDVFESAVKDNNPE